jgi:hypothetical protein
MTQWDSQLAAKTAALASLARTASSFRTSYGSFLKRYKGGMPANLLAAIASIESSGRMVPGDASLGEYGFFQVAAQTERDFGVPTGTRTGPEGNIFLGALEYNVEALRLALKYPAYVRNGSKGQWHLARLVFAIGRHGTDVCLQNAIAGGYVAPGEGFAGVVRWANATGAVAIGGSEAGKIWYRIRLVELTQKIADAIGPEGAGAPVQVPAPVGMSYTLPRDVLGRLPAGAAVGGAAILVAVGAVALYVLA